MLNSFTISQGHIFLTLISHKIWSPLHFQYFYFQKSMSRCKLRLMFFLLPCLERCSFFLDEDIKYLNGSYNTLDGKYFSGNGIKILRNNVSANVRGSFLYAPLTAYSSQHRCCCLTVFHFTLTKIPSMEKSLLKTPRTFLWDHWNLLWT